MRLIALALTIMLAACGGGAPTVIDGSSPERFKETMAAARAELTPGDRARFEAAVKLVQVSSFAKADSRTEMEARVRRKLDGKTAEAVIADYQEKQTAATDSVIEGVFDLKREIEQGVDAVKGERNP